MANLTKYYIWVESRQVLGEWNAHGDLHGYDSVVELEMDPGNIVAMELYHCAVLRAAPISYSYPTRRIS